MLLVFGFMRQKDLCRLAHVCKKWKQLAYDGKLWSRVSFRPDYGGLHVSNVEALVSLISARFSATLRYIELSAEMIMPAVLHELANRCPNVKYENILTSHIFNVRMSVCLSVTDCMGRPSLTQYMDNAFSCVIVYNGICGDGQKLKVHIADLKATLYVACSPITIGVVPTFRLFVRLLNTLIIIVAPCPLTVYI